MPLVPVDAPTRHVHDLGTVRTPGAGPAAPRTEHSTRVPTGLHEVLGQRRSLRRLSGSPVASGVLLSVLDEATATHRTLWPGAEHGTADLRFLVAAYHVENLAPGLYAGRRAICAPWLDCLTQTYVPAPALILVCGNVSAGTVGYAAALVEAGALGYAVWLCALRAGLVGSVFGGATTEVTAAARMVDQRLRHLFTVAVGNPERGGAQ